MKRTVLVFLLALLVVPARADQIPEFALNKFFDSCLGGEANDSARVGYCNCIRDAMRSWSEDDFSTMMEEQIKNPNQPPAKLDAQAKICIQKVLK